MNFRQTFSSAVIGACAIAVLAPGARAAGEEVVVPVTIISDTKGAAQMQTAVLAGGCFWGVESVFEHVKGVQKVVSGYAGGTAKDADYDVVSTGRTGHAESVQVTFNPREISYGEILRVFFSVAHDPTQLNRQGPDVGTQYRSAVFYMDDSQKKIAEAYIAQLDKAKVFERPIVTTVSADTGFYAAEDYHQDFLVNNPDNPYIVFNDLPKVHNLEKLFPRIYLRQPVTVYAANATR